jgi:ribose transport system ATP-binding protein
MVHTVANKTELLTFHGVTKRFGGVTALDDVDFDLRRGEIHALLGENGAGKSTLIKVLGGIHAPDSGTIRIEGEQARIHSVADANRHGVRIIHQELSLVPNLSIAENIYLGREPQGLAGLRRSVRDPLSGDYRVGVKCGPSAIGRNRQGSVLSGSHLSA